MVARERLLGGLRGLVSGGAIFLVPVVGFPWLATWMGADLTHLDLWRAWGTRLALAAPLAFVGLAVWRYRSLRTGHHRAQSALEGGARLVLLPRADGKPVRADRVRFWGRVVDLLPTCQHIAFELQATSTGVQFVAVVPQMLRGAFLTQLASEWPGTRARTLAREEDRLETGTDRAGWSVTLRPRSAELPLVATAADPLLAPLTELSGLPEGVAAGVQVVARSDPYSRRRLGTKATRRLMEQTKFTTPASKRTTRLLDERAQHAFLEVELRVWAHAGTAGLARRTAESLARSLCAQYEPSNPLLRAGSKAGLPSTRAFGMFGGSPWTEAELGQLAHLVGADVLAYVPTLATASANPLPPPAVARGPARGAWRSPRLRGEVLE